MWVWYYWSYSDRKWLVEVMGLSLLPFEAVQPSECDMMIPGTYAEMHEDYS